MRKRRLPKAFLTHYRDPYAVKLAQRRRAVIAIFVVAMGGWLWWRGTIAKQNSVEHAEAQKTTLSQVPTPAPMRVGLQVGHLDAAKLPSELGGVSWNFGASAGGVNEVDISKSVVEKVAKRLQDKDIVVDVLPATVPPGYLANAFISFHADGNEDASVSGFKVGASAWDRDGKAERLADILTERYGLATGLKEHPMITEDMTHYYAFNYNRFTHAVSPSTPATLLELGFITNAGDRQLIVRRSDAIATAVADAVLTFLDGER